MHICTFMGISTITRSLQRALRLGIMKCVQKCPDDYPILCSDMYCHVVLYIRMYMIIYMYSCNCVILKSQVNTVNNEVSRDFLTESPSESSILQAVRVSAAMNVCFPRQRYDI